MGCLDGPGAAPGSASATGCLVAPTPSGEVLASVGDQAITDARLEQRVAAQGNGRRAYESSRGLRELLDDELRFELLAQAALDRGLARDPEVVDAARRVMVRRLLQRDLGAALFEDRVGDKALRAFYELNRSNYLQPEKRRFADILLAPSDEGRAVAQSLVDKMQRGSADGDFSTLAARHSLDVATQSRGGDHPFQTRDELVAAYGQSFAATVFQQGPLGLLPQPVQSIHGWHVVRVVARREALARDFADVRDQIRERMVQSQRSAEFQRYLEEIRATYPVTVHEDRLQALLHRWLGK